MEVRLRLQRIKAAKHRYHFRIVAISRDTGRDARNLQILGFYDPSKKPMLLKIDEEGFQKWVDRGATMSDTVASLHRRIKRTTSTTKS